MTVITGQRQTSGSAGVGSAQRAIDMQEEILLLEPDVAPIAVLSQRTKKGSLRMATKDRKFSWWNDEGEDRWDAINNGAGYNSSATSIVVDDGTLFANDDIILIPRTGEQLRVSNVSTHTLTVERGWGATSGAAIVDNDPVYILGTAATEGATSPVARSENPVQSENYTQIFRESVEASGTLLSSDMMTNPHDWAHQHKKKAIEHLKEIENSALFGTPSDGLQRTSGGLLHFLTYNNQDAGGTLTETELETWLRTLSRYGDDLVVFASPLVISVINNFAIGRLQTRSGEKRYGLNIQEYISAHGTMQLVKHNLLEGAVYGGYAIAVNFKKEGIKYRYLNGSNSAKGTKTPYEGSRDTKLITNIQANDADGQKDEWLTECGWQVRNPKTGGVLTGVTG